MTTRENAMPQELPIRITLVHPPKDVNFCVQRGKDDLRPPAHADDETITFDFTVRVGGQQPDGAPNLLGPFTQGSPAERFVYVNAGTLAGQPDSPWTRRAKIKLAGITQAMIEETVATPGAVIEARIDGKAKDGGPPAASVPLLGGGWQIVP
jgi:hypothetical protein